MREKLEMNKEAAERKKEDKKNTVKLIKKIVEKGDEKVRE